MASELDGDGQSSSHLKLGTGPGCRVCGDEASGFHYGVDSCEGCKGFFRRCIIQGLTQQCANDEKCEVTAMTRNSCQYCRLKKCFAVGMSRGASRLGRRPKRLKSTCSSEAESSKPATSVKQLVVAPQSPQIGLLPLSMAEVEVLLDRLNRQNQCNIKLPSLLAALNSQLDKRYHLASSTAAASGSPSSEEARASGRSAGNESPKTRQLSPDSTAGCVDLSLTSDVRHCRVTTAQTGVGELPSVNITKTFVHSSHITSKCDAQALVAMVYLQLRDAEQRREMVCSSPPLLQPSETETIASETETVVTDVEPDCRLMVDQALLELAAEARQIPAASSEREALVQQVIRSVVNSHMKTCYHTREVVDAGFQRYRESRQSATAAVSLPDPKQVWSQFVSNMAPVIHRVVAFSKSLPGFSELCQDDQIKLVKQGSFEVIIARFVPLFTDDGMFVPDMSVKIPRHIMQEMPLGAFFEEQHTFAMKMNSLCLSDSELGLLNAIMIMNPSRAGLLNHRAVHKLRGLMLQCLYVHIKLNHPDTYDELFTKTVNILPLSDCVNQMHSQTLNNLKLTSPDIKFPDLHNEVYDGQP